MAHCFMNYNMRILALFLLLSFKAAAYQYEIAACLIFQNEAPYLKEWIEYHKLIGVEHFYLFDNASSDGFMEVLQPYLKSQQVELFHEPTLTESQKEHNAVQCGCYEKAIALAQGKAKWLAIIDADEYIVPLKTKSLSKVLRDYEDQGGLYVNWLMFGTSDIKKFPKGYLMMEVLTRSAAKANALGKSIVRPERVRKCTDPHRMWYHPSYKHVTSDFKTFKWTAPIADDKILIHHYHTRDLDHLIHVKYPRRLRWQRKKEKFKLDDYIESLKPHSVRENRSMQRFIPALRANMGLPVEKPKCQSGCGCRNK